MILSTTNEKRNIDVGSNQIWHSLFSTVSYHLSSHKEEISDALLFLKNASCSHEIAAKTARQINLIRDMLSQISPENIIYDINDLSVQAPWDGNISEITTSCGNFYTTSDGKDLLFEIVSILTYSSIIKTDVYSI